MAHHPGTHAIRRGTVQHAVLRVLDVCELSGVDSLAVAGDPERYTARRWGLEVLGPLREAGLLHWDRKTNTWGATDEGSALARKLGPLNDEMPDAAPDMRVAPAEPAPQHCGPRRYLATNSGRAPVTRPGSEDAATLPSRMGDRLHWPDGRVTDVLTTTSRPAGQAGKHRSNP